MLCLFLLARAAKNAKTVKASIVASTMLPPAAPAILAAPSATEESALPQLSSCDFNQGRNLNWYPGKGDKEKALLALLSFSSTTIERLEGKPNICLEEGAMEERGIPDKVITNNTSPAELAASAAKVNVIKFVNINTIVLKDGIITVSFSCAPPKPKLEEGKKGSIRPKKPVELKFILKNSKVLIPGSVAFKLAEIIKKAKGTQFDFPKINELPQNGNVTSIFKSTEKTLVVQVVGNKLPDGTSVPKKVELKVPAPCSNGGEEAALKSYVVRESVKKPAPEYGGGEQRRQKYTLVCLGAKL